MEDVQYLMPFKEMSLKVVFRESAWTGWECFIESKKSKLPISFGFGDAQIEALKMAVDNFPKVVYNGSIAQSG